MITIGHLTSLLLIFFQVAGWELFAEVNFRWEYDEELELDIEIPTFNRKVRELEGKQITLTGYYLPMDLTGNRIIISKQPYASCFFCGGDGGPETVAEIVFGTVQRPFRIDELLTVKGILQLNKDDYDHMVFILTEAKVIEP